jgi:hypothetical protein
MLDPHAVSAANRKHTAATISKTLDTYHGERAGTGG